MASPSASGPPRLRIARAGGHWEARPSVPRGANDTHIANQGSSSAIPASRMLDQPGPPARTRLTVVAALIAKHCRQRSPEELRRSLTWDQRQDAMPTESASRCSTNVPGLFCDRAAVPALSGHSLELPCLPAGHRESGWLHCCADTAQVQNEEQCHARSDITAVYPSAACAAAAMARTQCCDSRHALSPDPAVLRLRDRRRQSW